MAAASRLNLPGSQSVHAVDLPSETLKRPGSHSMHKLMCPAAEFKLYRPLTQAKHTAIPVPAFVPEYLPAIQLTHDVASSQAPVQVAPSTVPCDEEYLPLTQASHADAAMAPLP